MKKWFLDDADYESVRFFEETFIGVERGINRQRFLKVQLLEI